MSSNSKHSLKKLTAAFRASVRDGVKNASITCGTAASVALSFLRGSKNDVSKAVKKFQAWRREQLDAILEEAQPVAIGRSQPVGYSTAEQYTSTVGKLLERVREVRSLDRDSAGEVKMPLRDVLATWSESYEQNDPDIYASFPRPLAVKLLSKAGARRKASPVGSFSKALAPMLKSCKSVADLDKLAESIKVEVEKAIDEKVAARRRELSRKVRAA